VHDRKSKSNLAPRPSAAPSPLGAVGGSPRHSPHTASAITRPRYVTLALNRDTQCRRRFASGLASKPDAERAAIPTITPSPHSPPRAAAPTQRAHILPENTFFPPQNPRQNQPTLPLRHLATLPLSLHRALTNQREPPLPPSGPTHAGPSLQPASQGKDHEVI
jgi:hypothetical protein